MLAQIHLAGTERDRAGNRQFFYDQYLAGVERDVILQTPICNLQSSALDYAITFPR